VSPDHSTKEALRSPSAKLLDIPAELSKQHLRRAADGMDAHQVSDKKSVPKLHGITRVNRRICNEVQKTYYLQIPILLSHPKV